MNLEEYINSSERSLNCWIHPLNDSQKELSLFNLTSKNYRDTSLKKT